MSISLCLFIVVLGLSLWRYVKHRLRSKGHPYPPGPNAIPVFGNIWALFTGERWKLLGKYQRLYGDIVHLHGMGVHIISVNSLQAVDDLLGKRGTINSHRPVFTVVGELMGLDQSTPLLSYGSEWRTHRKLSHTILSASTVKKYNGLQENLATLLCSDLLDKPGLFFKSSRLYATRVVLTITYGLSVRTADDLYVKQAHDTMSIVSRSTIPGAFLCDIIPLMKYLPSWMNLKFQKEAKIGRHMIETLVTLPYEHVKRNIMAGNASPSLARDLLLSTDAKAASDHQVKWTAGSLYGAGGEATYSTIVTFILAMVLNPEKQMLARNEMDTVIGNRLPMVSDMPHLPYVCAAIKETMRWYPLLPLTLARRTAKDDYYNGYFIPEGTLLIPNVWSIAFQDDDKYDPHNYLPERFLDPTSSAVDPGSWAFGFGRRICPGKDLAQDSVFIAVAMILHCFDLSPLENVPIIPEFDENLLRYLKPFKCQIKPRSQEYAALITSRATEFYI